MKIYLHEIKENDREVQVSEQDGWVASAISALDESTADVPGSTESLRPQNLRTRPAIRPASIRFNLRRVDDVIVVSGDLQASVQLLCSRCAAPFLLKFDEKFSALYCKDKEMAGIAYLDKNAKPRGQNQGFARHAHDFEAVTGQEADEDLELNYIAEDFLDLANVLTEQLQVRIPFQPLCKEDCKGVCANCGADLNVGRCACAKLQNKSPFAALKGLKIQS